MNYVKFLCSAMIVAALLFSGCKKTDTSSTGPTNTTPTTAKGTYTGVLAGSTSSGSMSLNIPSSSSSFAKTASGQIVVVVTGSVVLGSDTVNVTGSYNTSNDSLYVSGSLNGETFAFLGTFNPATNALNGAWSDSNGDGGYFAAAGGAASTVKVYEGTATSSTQGRGSAQLDMVVSGTSIFGVASIGSERQFFTGTVSNGTSITLTYNAPVIGNTNIGTGSFTNGGASANGNYQLLSIDSGTWNVTLVH